MKYLIETFGCQMNFHDSERMAGLLEQAGYEPAADERKADVIVINTCSVRERAEEKLFTRLGEIRQMHQERGARPVVAVAGCVAQQEGSQILQRSRAVDVVIGTQNLKRLPMLVDRAIGAAAPDARPVIDLNPIEDISFPLGVARRSGTLGNGYALPRHTAGCASSRNLTNRNSGQVQVAYATNSRRA